MEVDNTPQVCDIEYLSPEYDLYSQIGAVETRLTARMKQIEKLLEAQNIKIETILNYLTRDYHLPDQNNIDAEYDDNDSLQVKNTITVEKKMFIHPSKIENSPTIVECIEENEEQITNYEIVDCQPILMSESNTIKKIKKSRILPKVNDIPQFPIKHIEVLRGFNKALGSNNDLLQKFTKIIHSIIDGAEIENVPSLILNHTISLPILGNSTWASKSNGKLRIASLTNYLKCILDTLQPFDINASFFRSRSIELLQKVKAIK